MNNFPAHRSGLREWQPVNPILHLSLPIRDLAESRHFYVDVLGCDPGREDTSWMDVWFYEKQVTLHERPDQVLAAEEAGVRHFGVALGEEQFVALDGTRTP